jgi:GT2 family glycosyltransferase
MTFDFSIVIPTTGMRPTIFSLLSNLRTQGYLDRGNVEVIVVENTPQPSGKLAAELERWGVVYAHEPTQGQAAALNRGLALARGRWLAFTDDDVSIKTSTWLDDLAAPLRADERVGYVAGNVLAVEVETPAQQMWEMKGGLSKGTRYRRFDQDFFRRNRLKGVPLRLIACGANAMAPRAVMEEVGGFNPWFGCGSAVGHAQSHEIVYKILRAGYTAVYEPDACVHHAHPRTRAELRRKLFHYGIGDTAVHLHFFMTYGDYRGLLEALFARHLYLWKNTLYRAFGRYPLPLDVMAASLAGAALGPVVYLRTRWTA